MKMPGWDEGEMGLYGFTFFRGRGRRGGMARVEGVVKAKKSKQVELNWV